MFSSMEPEQDSEKRSYALGTSSALSAAKWTKLSEDFETRTALRAWISGINSTLAIDS